MAALANLLCNAWEHPLARRDRIGTFRRIIDWQVRSRIAAGQPIERPWLNDARLMLRKGQSGATGNLYYGLHEFADMAFFAHFLRPDDVFADIGANVGSYTVLAGKVVGATVHAFEPDEAALASLRQHVALNGMGDRVTVHTVALGDQDGTARFTVGRDAMNALVDEGTGAKTVEVEVRTADSLLAGHEVIAMKVDVEGGEQAVFAGAEALLAEPQLRAIEVETVAGPMREMIASAGFREYWYDPDGHRLSTEPNGVKRNNTLFLRDVEFVSRRLADAPSIRFGRRSL